MVISNNRLGQKSCFREELLRLFKSVSEKIDKTHWKNLIAKSKMLTNSILKANSGGDSHISLEDIK